ncbi:MAG: SprB repeat-containing protein [Bacteroidota bacterium]
MAFLLIVIFLQSCTEDNTNQLEESSKNECHLFENNSLIAVDIENKVTMVSLGPSGGTPPYEALWSNGETNLTVGFINPGAYSFTITDSEDCTLIDQIEVAPITDCDDLDLQLVEEHSGILTVQATGGTPPYSYSWSKGSEEATIEVSMSGVYTVFVGDSASCS